jgi:AAA domain
MSNGKPAVDLIAKFRPKNKQDQEDLETLPPIRSVDITKWGIDAAPEPIWKIRNLIAAGETGCLAGRSNCGKGLLSLELAVAITLGRGLFGREGTCEPQVVVFVEMEDSPEEMERRLCRLLDLYRLEPHWTEADAAMVRRNLIILVPDWKSKQAKTLPTLVPIIHAKCQEITKEGRIIGLIILDTLAALGDGDENSVEALRGIWPSCYELRDATGACVLLVHHTRKAFTSAKAPRLMDRLNFDTLRGSSAIVAGARFILQMEPLTSGEAGKLGLDEEKAQRGGYTVLGMTKVVSGPKGGMLLLEQFEGIGGGFWGPHPRSAFLIAQLQSSGAVEKLTIAEAVLKSIASGLIDRKALARQHWPDRTETKAREALKGVLNHLRNRHGWLEPGDSMNLTPAGRQRVRELLSVSTDPSDETSYDP